MTSLNRPRRRAEHFAALVDATPLAWDSAAADHLDRELVELLQLVGTLRDHPAATGLDEAATHRPAHALALRERLMTEAAEVLTPERAERHAVLTLPPRARGARERRLAAAATVLVVLGGTAGMASAAERALPGQALYPVKRSIERVDVVLSTSTAGKGRDVLHQASTRLDEVKQLAEGPLEGQQQIPATMQEFAHQAQQGAQLMIAAYKETADPATLQTVQAFAQSEGDQVEALARNTSVVEPESLMMAATALNDIQDTATATCEGEDCPVAPFNPVLLAGSTDVAPPSMRAADGSVLDSGDLPTELGTVPAVGDGSTLDASAPSDGSAVDSLPGLASDPSPLPGFPIPGLPGLGGNGSDPGTGSGDGSGTATDPSGGTTTAPGDGGSSPSSGPTDDPPSSTPDPTEQPSDPASPDPTPSDPPSSEAPSPSTPTETAPDGGGDAPSASADGGDEVSGSGGSSSAGGDAAGGADAGDAAADAAP